jgi:chromosome partitioning protein
MGGTDMPENSPKAIAIINPKGGVGKTTATWCLGEVLSSTSNQNVLMFDLDPQMTLTQAVALHQDVHGRPQEFGKWYQKSIDSKKTILDALDNFTKPAQHFDVDYDFIYQVSDRLHFLPAVEALYWQEDEVLDRPGVREFIPHLLEEVANSPNVARYNYILDSSVEFMG